MAVLAGHSINKDNFEILDSDGNNIVETISGIRSIKIDADKDSIVTATVEIMCSKIKVCGVLKNIEEHCPAGYEKPETGNFFVRFIRETRRFMDAKIKIKPIIGKVKRSKT